MNKFVKIHDVDDCQIVVRKNINPDDNLREIVLNSYDTETDTYVELVLVYGSEEEQNTAFDMLNAETAEAVIAQAVRSVDTDG